MRGGMLENVDARQAGDVSASRAEAMFASTTRAAEGSFAEAGAAPRESAFEAESARTRERIEHHRASKPPRAA